MAQPTPDWRTQDIKIDRSVYDLAAGVLLVIVATVIGLALFPDDKGFQGNLYTTILGVLITIFVLDRRAERREALRAENELKARLIREMGSSVNEVTVRAVEELWRRGWLQDGSLRQEKFVSANLQNVALHGADLEKIDLSVANLQKSVLWKTNLRGSRLFMTNFKGADMVGINLQETILESTNLRNTNLFMGDIQKADLLNADLEEASLVGTNLKGANLKNANLSKCILSTTKFNENTILPDGTNWTPETDMSRFTDPKYPNFWRSNDPGSPAFSHR